MTTKIETWIPISREQLEDFGDGMYFYRAQGWPNRCVSFLGTGINPHPCFIHTRFSDQCR